MFSRRSLKIYLFPAANILVGIFLISIFVIAGQNVTQTFSVARMAALNNLQPQPADYFLDLNIRHAPPDKNKIHCYVDYYEHLLQDFPNLWDAYGMLGYCFHYLGDDPKAVKFLTIAIEQDPDIFWNYYNLAAIYISESRYQQAYDLLHKALTVPPVNGLKKMFTSSGVYLPLFEPDEKKALAYTSGHIQETYRSSFVLIQILNQVDSSKKAREVMRNIKLDLYAF